jgi:predicted phage gp36 major capsid-like protein
MPGTRDREASNDGPSDGTPGPALLSHARRAAGSLVDNVQQRLPADMAKQVREGQRTVERNLKRLQQQMRRSATQADVDRLSQRIDELGRDVEALIAESRRGGRASSGRTGSDASSPARTGRSGTARTSRRSPSEGGAKRSGGGGPQSSAGGAEESEGGPEAG